jgi:hypothetical protein
MARSSSRARSFRRLGCTVLRMTPRTPMRPTRSRLSNGQRFPTCRHCKGITFELGHAAKHVSEVPHLHQEASPQHALIGTA